MRSFSLLALAAIALSALTSSANADINLSLEATATTYSTLLTFDEMGGPTGIIDPSAFAGIGIAELQAGDGVPQVGDFSGPPGGPWIGSDNSFFGNFGLFLTFAGDVNAFNAQIFDPSGPPGPLGGGLGVFVFNDDVEVANGFFTPAWGGIGDEWLNITTDGGQVFDEVRVLGFGFPATTFADDISFNQIPEPATTFVLGAVALLGLVRRR